MNLGSVVGIATCYELDGPNSGGGKDFYALVQTGPGTHPASLKWVPGLFPRMYSGRGVALTNHPHLALKLKKE